MGDLKGHKHCCGQLNCNWRAGMIRGQRRPMSGDPDAIAALSESVLVELEGARARVTTGRSLEDVLQGLAIVDEIQEPA